MKRRVIIWDLCIAVSMVVLAASVLPSSVGGTAAPGPDGRDPELKTKAIALSLNPAEWKDADKAAAADIVKAWLAEEWRPTLENRTIAELRTAKVGKRVMFEDGLWAERLDADGIRGDNKIPEEAPVCKYVVEVWLQENPLAPDENEYVGHYGAAGNPKMLAQLLKMIAMAHCFDRSHRRVFAYIRDVQGHTWCKPSGTPIADKNAYAIELDVRSGDIRE